MLKVLLVDDEPFISQGLSILIDWETEGFEIVKICQNAFDALDFLRSQSVDLIIADIQMPGMSGLQMLEVIQKEKISDAKIVILSGYSDFSYAQQALRFNCMDYVLKPVEREQMLSILRKVADLSESTRQNEEKQQKQEQAYLARNLIALLLGKYDSANLEYVRKNLHLSEGVRYINIEFDAMQADEVEEGMMRENQRKLYQLCREYLKDDVNHVIFDVSSDEKSFDTGLIYCDSMSERFHQTESEFLEELHEYLEMALGRKISMLAGKKVQDISGISKSFGSANVLKSQEAFHPQKKILYYEEEVQVSQSGVIICKNSLDELIGAIERNEKSRIGECVDQLYDEMKGLGVARETINLNINYLLFQLIHLASEQDDEVNQEEILHLISESTFEEGISRGSRRHMTMFSCEYADYLSQLRRNMSGGILTEIEKEVRENYAQNLSLRDFGTKFFVNSSYLGQIFRKKYNMTFKDYLTNYRINEAAKLLLSTDRRIVQIAEDVGYHDSDYFIRKFIEIKGCTPAKYRKNSTN